MNLGVPLRESWMVYLGVIPLNHSLPMAPARIVGFHRSQVAPVAVFVSFAGRYQLPAPHPWLSVAEAFGESEVQFRFQPPSNGWLVLFVVRLDRPRTRWFRRFLGL